MENLEKLEEKIRLDELKKKKKKPMRIHGKSLFKIKRIIKNKTRK